MKALVLTALKKRVKSRKCNKENKNKPILCVIKKVHVFVVN